MLSTGSDGDAVAPEWRQLAPAAVQWVATEHAVQVGGQAHGRPATSTLQRHILAAMFMLHSHTC